MALPPECNKNITKPYRSVLAAVLLTAPLIANATALQFTLDTSSLSGTDAYLTFSFINHDSASNSTTVSDFLTDGTLGDASTILTDGDVTGGLIPGPVTLSDTSLRNEFLQLITLGNQVSFILTLTENAPSGMPYDSFSFFLLDDNTSLPLFDTDDPTGAGALFAVDIDGSSSGIRYPFNYVGSGQPVTWTLELVAVPLPSTALLMGAGLLGGLTARRRGSLHNVA